MKLNLEQRDGIAVIKVEGAVDARNFQVLKAGLTKLLRDGRNRIVLSLEACGTIENDALREIAILDVMARELSGQIVICSTDESVKQAVINFSKPPVIPFLATVDLAVDYFNKQKPDAELEPEDAGELKKKLEAKQKEVEALEAKIKALDPAEIQKARAMAAEAQAKVKMLEEQMESLLVERRKPVDASGFMAKIEALEETVKKLSEQSKEKDGSANKG